MNRDKKYRIYQTQRAIAHKLRIIRENFLEGSEEWFCRTSPHRLDKGKVHCSCYDCSQKTKTHGQKHSDVIREERHK